MSENDGWACGECGAPRGHTSDCTRDLREMIAATENRSTWTSRHEWRDPDCFECGGSGAPCCEPPDGPPPVRDPSHDGIYPRCVWCNGENYALAVLAYSTGDRPCAAVPGCGRYLPAGYRKRGGL